MTLRKIIYPYVCILQTFSAIYMASCELVVCSFVVSLCTSGVLLWAQHHQWFSINMESHHALKHKDQMRNNHIMHTVHGSSKLLSTGSSILLSVLLRILKKTSLNSQASETHVWQTVFIFHKCFDFRTGYYFLHIHNVRPWKTHLSGLSTLCSSKLLLLILIVHCINAKH